jgi:GT2 family glycosyltransferase
VRDRLHAGGWEVVDSAVGSQLRALPPPRPTRGVTMLTLDQGWPDDLRRWRESVEAHTEGDFEVLVVDGGAGRGWAEAANQGLAEAAGEVVILFDPGTELTGDVAGPLVAALADPTVAVAGPFGVRGKGTLKEFESHPGPDVDAIESYCLALRRADAEGVGGFDPRFRFYRIADFELSFRLRDQGGRRALVVPGLPILKHAHRLWEATPEAERARLSKKNFYRFLDRWGGREDLLTDRGDQGGGAQGHQDHAGDAGDPGPHSGPDAGASASDRSGDDRPPGR